MARRLEEYEYRDQNSSKTDLAPWLLGVLPLLGAAIYVSLRGTYASLYSRFGVAPEEVGLDYFAVLTGAVRIFRLGNMADIYLGSETLGIPVFLIIIALVVGFAYYFRRRSPKLAAIDSRGFVLGCIAGVLAMIVIVLSVGLGLERDSVITQITSGNRVRPGSLHLLTSQAYRVKVLPLDEKIRAVQQDLFDSETLVYLGRGDGSLVLYDFINRKTWKVPASNVIMRIDPCTKTYKPSEADCDWNG